jgi:Na+-translocating ferredoxin:NAD+ oxidoreductase RnfC subunit
MWIVWLWLWICTTRQKNKRNKKKKKKTSENAEKKEETNARMQKNEATEKKQKAQKCGIEKHIVFSERANSISENDLRSVQFEICNVRKRQQSTKSCRLLDSGAPHLTKKGFVFASDRC